VLTVAPRQTGPTGAYFVGSAETVAKKIAWAMRTLRSSRFLLKYAVGDLPHEQRLESIRGDLLTAGWLPQ
jgi:hypothetical protein